MLNLSSSYSPTHSVRPRSSKNAIIVAPTYSFTQKTTTVSYSWPPTITGVERIALSAQGDLQRVLSAYFARPISIAVVYEVTHWQRSPDTPPELLKHPGAKAIASASPATPIIQTRQVHLQCSGKIVCTATSTVRITSPNAAHLFLVDKYAIGQTFRRLESLPVFELLSVGLGSDSQDNDINPGEHSLEPNLQRRYKLTVPSFDCDIVEVFPDRNMFIHGEAWLNDRAPAGNDATGPQGTSLQKFKLDTSHANVLENTSNVGRVFGISFILVFIYELVILIIGRGVHAK
ncbi:hypothetical protein P691DRAFT_796516 [Macrolepiota fuliginosa MF-IS2]|uniref:Uncharacterized protein n=1 Tax=Macrolepiota fuliginosa MF-IS2 TaxID=1400762 RepID=A0A9P6C0D1_9AGAR|nr:hypothetical protein P691DRAFT_796516 [Macrolepiota fuliginosa MF-IS2]